MSTGVVSGAAAVVIAASRNKYGQALPPNAAKLMCSTLLTSIVTLATSRKKRTRSPLAEMSTFSLAFEPLNSIVSVPD